MPRETSFLNERPMVNEGDFTIGWKRKTGRQIFNMRTIGGFNQIPVIIHSSYILGNAQVKADSEPPLDLNQLTEALIVDGTLVILKPERGDKEREPEFLTNILTAMPTFVVHVLEKADKDGNKVTREWRRINGRWNFTDWIHHGSDDAEKIGSGSIDEERIYVFPNGIGILATSYDTMYRLEEIRLRVRKGTNEAITLIVSGYGGDVQQTEEAMSDPTKTKLIVPKTVAVDFINTTAAVDQFLADGKDLLPNFWKLVRLIEVGDNLDISGIARRLIMQPMLQYITSNQKKIAKIYKDWGYDIQFDSVPTMSIDERTQELELLKQLRDAQAITPEEFNERAKKLA